MTLALIATVSCFFASGFCLGAAWSNRRNAKVREENRILAKAFARANAQYDRPKYGKLVEESV